ncbi:MAG: helix-turn-helix transcriptional regulator [Candidatus Eisenbacteria bacterium]|uniref:Helix-turn-helix transcriptional regulator n=1 Tax=Eiseniibacteriota bacterium TaxID=2212470 RepID=A0A956N9W1_UNCEI|nr:helix-turn-helix transcriptional regulator [Candidatus Eisenbacteria bacterium]
MAERKTDPVRGVLEVGGRKSQRIFHERFYASPDLAPFIEHFWTVRWDLTGDPPQAVSTLPHPVVHFVMDSGNEAQVSGPTRARFQRELRDEGCVFAVKFRPGGFRPFLGGPVSALADRVLPACDVFGAEASALAAAVWAAVTVEERIERTESFLRERVAEPDPTVELVSRLVDEIAREPGITKVQDVVSRAGVGMRSLQRIFSEYVGVSPKWVLQRYRLHEAADRLAKEGTDLATLALDLGYSDQAHFVRDFRLVVGETPGSYARKTRQTSDPRSREETEC